MTTRQIIAITLLLPFLALTGYTLWTVGLIGIFDYQLRSPAGWQVFTDLVIALILVLMWLVPDARRCGRNPWPWVAATLLTGSIGPLLYLATDKAPDPQN